MGLCVGALHAIGITAHAGAGAGIGAGAGAGAGVGAAGKVVTVEGEEKNGGGS